MLQQGDGAISQPPSLVEQQEPPAAAAPPPTEAPPAAAPVAAETSASAGPSTDFTGAHAGPSVRRLARELGVDLATVGGSGPKGRITKDDLLAVPARAGRSGRHAAAAAPAAGAGIPEIPAQDFSKFGPTETVPLSRIKKVSGPFLHRSWLNVPHVTHNDEADITELDAYRKELDTAAKADAYRVTLLAFLVKACVSALKAFPEFNSSLTPEKDALILKSYYNIGIAVDTPGGLVVPVVKDADRKGIVELCREFMAISGKARDGKLAPADMAGGTLHHLQPRRHRRHQLHPDRQRPRGRDPRRGALQDGPGLERHRVRPAQHAAAVAVLRPPGRSTARWPPGSPGTCATCSRTTRRLRALIATPPEQRAGRRSRSPTSATSPTSR